MNNSCAQSKNNVYINLTPSSAVDALALTDWREECIIIRVTEGEGTIYIDDENFIAQKNDYFVLRSFVTYSLHKKDESLFAVQRFIFNTRLIANKKDDAYNMADFQYFINEKNVPCAIKKDLSWYSIFDECASGLFEEKSDSNKFELLYKTVSILYNNRFASSELNLTEEKQRFAIKTILTSIKSDYTSKVSVKKIAESVSYDEFYTMKLFKKFTGLSIIEYVNRYRIYLARVRLTDTNEAISRIANEVGFSNISYFNRQFKRLTGVTPAIYRLNQQNSKTF